MRVDKTDFVPGLSTNGGHDFCPITGLYESCFSCPWNEDGECIILMQYEVIIEQTVNNLQYTGEVYWRFVQFVGGIQNHTRLSQFFYPIEIGPT